MRGRPVLYAALALAVPLPALALTGGGSAEASLSVSASLDGCGTSSAAIVCRIDATWNEIPGAERYTASVTRADGSVVDFGDVGSGGSSFTVPYAGNGTYTVTVSAYGTPPGSDEPEVVARDTSGTGGDSGEATVEAFGEATTDDGPGEGEVPPDPEPSPNRAPRTGLRGARARPGARGAAHVGGACRGGRRRRGRRRCRRGGRARRAGRAGVSAGGHLQRRLSTLRGWPRPCSKRSPTRPSPTSSARPSRC